MSAFQPFTRALAGDGGASGATRTRVCRVYLGHPHPGWPMSTVDLPAEMKRFEEYFGRLSAELAELMVRGADLDALIREKIGALGYAV